MNVVEHIEEIVRAASGLASETLGRSAVERAVLRRMEKREIGSMEKYEKEVVHSPSELQALIEALVVPETWFFRNAEAFTALVRHAFASARSGRLFRVLCVPCSSGEEPYSAAMALLQAGVAPASFEIDAVDISHKELEVAKQAIYGRNSFRGSDLAFRKRYFAQFPGGFALHANVRRCVRFEQANLLAVDFSRKRRKFDAIFCRNLLIYFDPETQARAIRSLSELLEDGGLFFSGPSEAALLLHNGFESSRIPHAFAFRRVSLQVASAQVRAVVPVENGKRLVPSQSIRPVSCVRKQDPLPIAPRIITVENALEEVQRLADDGRLIEAEKVCDQYIRDHGPCAQAYYLLGLLKDAKSDSEIARELYRKAVYLDPEHYESLLQLALLSEQEGHTSAAAYRERARRVSARARINRRAA